MEYHVWFFDHFGYLPSMGLGCYPKCTDWYINKQKQQLEFVVSKKRFFAISKGFLMNIAVDETSINLRKWNYYCIASMVIPLPSSILSAAYSTSSLNCLSSKTFFARASTSRHTSLNTTSTHLALPSSISSLQAFSKTSLKRFHLC